MHVLLIMVNSQYLLSCVTKYHNNIIITIDFNKAITLIKIVSVQLITTFGMHRYSIRISITVFFVVSC